MYNPIVNNNLDKRNLAVKLLLFFIWPFGAFLFSLKDIRSRSSRVVVFLWFIAFGIGFSAENERADSYRYVQEFEQNQFQTSSQFTNNVKDFFTPNSSIKDLYSLTLNFFVSRFTNNYHYLFLIVSVIFAFFYLKSLKYLVTLPFRGDKVLQYLLIFLFCFSNPIFNINGYRFWTAAWIGVFLIFKIFISKQYKYIPFLFLLPLVHGGYVIFLIFILIIICTRRFYKAWIPIFILSSFLSVTSFLDFLHTINDFLPVKFQNFIYSYTESETALEKMSGTGDYAHPLYSIILNALPIIHLNLLVFISILRVKYLNSRDSINQLAFILIWVTLCNFLMSIPSVGNRFIQLIIPFIAFFWLKHSSIFNKYNFLIYIIPVIYSYQILYWFRHMISISDFTTYIFPFPLIILQNLL